MTPHAFRIAPGLLGAPLASPARRGLAMLADLAAVGILTALLKSIGGILFALMFAWIFWRVANRRQESPGRGSGRGFKVLAAIALLAALTQAWDAMSGVTGSSWSRGRGGSRAARVDRDTAAVATLRSMGLGDLAGGLGDVMALRSGSTSPKEARRAAVGFASRLEQTGASRSDIRDALQGLLGDRADSATRASILAAAMAQVDSARGRKASSTDSLLLAWSAAVRAGDTATAARRREQVTDAVSGRQIGELRSRNADLQKKLAQARKTPGILSFLKGVAHDLGFGVGWLGLYFTAFPVFWKGKTPGKRLLGIRAVRLSGEPMTWWASFSRFGGYAAGLATGLLGFLQIFWDANRQGIQDQIAGTVVIRDRRSDR